MTQVTLEEVADRLAIHDVLCRYARGIDRCDEDVLRGVWWPGALADYGNGATDAGAWSGDVVKALSAMRRTQHFLGNVLISVDDSSAEAETYCRAYHEVEGPDGLAEMEVGGRYLDRLEKRDGEWRIAHRRYVLDWSRNGASTAKWDGPMYGNLKRRGARRPDDPSYTETDMDAATLDRTDLDPRVARLLDKDACRELVHKFARAIDRCDAALIGEILHSDATDDHGSFKGTGKDFVPWVMEVLAGMRRTQHVVGNVLIELDGDTAYGESYFIAHHALPKEGGDTFMIAAGRYLDRFERRDGEWRIAHRGAVYDWSSAVASTDMWDRDALTTHAFGQRGEGDPSYRHFAGGAWQG